VERQRPPLRRHLPALGPGLGRGDAAGAAAWLRLVPPTITSPEENRFVFGLIAGKPQFFVEGNYGPWIGGFQTDSKVEPGGHWRWVTGEPFSYTDWAAGKPDNGSGGDPLLEPGIPPGQGEGFLHYYGPSGGWNDLNVNAQPHGSILEFDQEHKKSCTP
jgi:hypothetical protein